MLTQKRVLNGCVLVAAAGALAGAAFSLQPQVLAQPSTPAVPSPAAASGSFQGRGIAQGAAFNRGRNANAVLIIERDNFSFELIEPAAASGRSQPPARVQYRGAITRRTNDPAGANNFTLNTRVRSFDSSQNLRIITNTTGTCRIEVFDARVISSSCNTVADNSSTEFLGLEQF